MDKFMVGVGVGIMSIAIPTIFDPVDKVVYSALAGFGIMLVLIGYFADDKKIKGGKS